MIHAKGIPTFPTPPVVKAHRAAMAPLKALVAAHNEAQDYELLGLARFAPTMRRGRARAFRRGSTSNARETPSRRSAGSS